MHIGDGEVPLRALLAKLSVALYTEARAAAMVDHMRDLVREPLDEFRRQCGHRRVLHVKSAPYITEADDIHPGDRIVVCHDPLRICLDCGLIERFELAERFTDKCPRERRVHAGDDEKQALEQQSARADRTAKFRDLIRPKKKISADQFLRITSSYSCLLTPPYLKPEDLYPLWLEYGEPEPVTSPPASGTES